MIRVLLADTSPLIRLAVGAALESAADITILSECVDSPTAIALAWEAKPDVVLLGWLPEDSIADVCAAIRRASPSTKVLLLWESDPDSDVLGNLLACGMAGAIRPSDEPDGIAAAIHAVAAGQFVIGNRLVLNLLRQGAAEMRRRAANSVASLSDHERHILPLIAEGKTNRQIACELHLSENTVRIYVSRLLHKLHVPRRAGAAHFWRAFA